jgi:hypothetical protein
MSRMSTRHKSNNISLTKYLVMEKVSKRKKLANKINNYTNSKYSNKINNKNRKRKKLYKCKHPFIISITLRNMCNSQNNKIKY